MYQDAIYIFVFSDIAKFTDFRLTHFSPVSHFQKCDTGLKWVNRKSVNFAMSENTNIQIASWYIISISFNFF